MIRLWVGGFTFFGVTMLALLVIPLDRPNMFDMTWRPPLTSTTIPYDCEIVVTELDCVPVYRTSAAP